MYYIGLTPFVYPFVYPQLGNDSAAFLMDRPDNPLPALDLFS